MRHIEVERERERLQGPVAKERDDLAVRFPLFIASKLTEKKLLALLHPTLLILAHRAGLICMCASAHRAQCVCDKRRRMQESLCW